MLAQSVVTLKKAAVGNVLAVAFESIIARGRKYC